MGLFNKIKSIFSKKEEIVENLDEEILESEELDEEELDSEVVEAIETNKYVEGLSKSRDNFVNKLSISQNNNSNLTIITFFIININFSI